MSDKEIIRCTASGCDFNFEIPSEIVCKEVKDDFICAKHFNVIMTVKEGVEEANKINFMYEMAKFIKENELPIFEEVFKELQDEGVYPKK